MKSNTIQIGKTLFFLGIGLIVIRLLIIPFFYSEDLSKQIEIFEIVIDSFLAGGITYYILPGLRFYEKFINKIYEEIEKEKEEKLKELTKPRNRLVKSSDKSSDSNSNSKKRKENEE